MIYPLNWDKIWTIGGKTKKLENWILPNFTEIEVITYHKGSGFFFFVYTKDKTCFAKTVLPTHISLMTIGWRWIRNGQGFSKFSYFSKKFRNFLEVTLIRSLVLCLLALAFLRHQHEILPAHVNKSVESSFLILIQLITYPLSSSRY